MLHSVLFILCGCIAGIAAGLFGIGGGIVLIPMFILFFSYSQKSANGISLVALLLPVGILGALEYWRAGKIGSIEIRYGLLTGLGIFLGTFLGAKLALMLLPDSWLQRLFAVLLILVGLRLLFLPSGS